MPRISSITSGNSSGDRGKALLHQQRLAARLSSRKPSASTTSSTALPTAMASGLPPKVVPWTPVGHARGRRLGGQDRAHRKAAANALGDRHDVGRNARPFMSEELAGAANAALDLVEDLAAGRACRTARAARVSDCAGNGADAALALHRLKQDRGRFGPMTLLGAASMSSNGTWSKPSTFGPNPSRYFCLAAGGDGRQRAAVEGAFEGDGAETFGLAVDVLIAARGLDRALDRLGARIGEEHLVGEGRGDQPLGKARPVRGSRRGWRGARACRPAR